MTSNATSNNTSSSPSKKTSNTAFNETSNATSNSNVTSKLILNAISNSTSKSNVNSTMWSHDDIQPQCTYRHLEYCHPYIRNVFALYTRSGGWILLGVVLVGCTLQIHTLVTRKRDEPLWTHASMRRNRLTHLNIKNKSSWI